ncbi:broad-complex core protein isoforms 1/2/3/4/5-like isoform X2 [Anthonomus grandis grandis]|uniref:broad-complex core protein isoforms 1/2/3/4/5-like isoform X2 n=1 Tax=Anthonomus grandis grandis TaxID=2921223 RepID=UPI0021657E9C|nr:broad-complex core protein isoforms 1/2/3/4/5-like isoform X2 [Anthonomus grandis grandis]
MTSPVTTEQFSLRWNNFHSNLKSGFHELLQHAEMVDVTLAVDGHFLQAHKVVLSICSPYFKKMFRENPCKHPIVIMKDVGHENMKDILQFMYMGEVSVLRENLSSFLRTAETLQVKGLTGDDTNDEAKVKKEQKPPETPTPEIDENEMYGHLIETTEVEVPVQYVHRSATSPPQTSPLPLNCTRKQQSQKSTSPQNAKRQKCTESSGYAYKPSEPETTPKPPSDSNNFNSCDLTGNNHNKSTNESDEAKDYSKNRPAGLWSGNVGGAPIGDTVAGVGMEQTTSEQDVLYPTDSKGHVFCPYCCRKFVNKYNLKVHIRDKHESMSTDLDCQVCGKTMRNLSCLRVHLYHHRKQQIESAGVLS